MILCYKKLAALKLRHIFFLQYFAALIAAFICVWLLDLMKLPFLSLAVMYRAYYLPYTKMNMKMELYEERYKCRKSDLEKKLEIGSFDVYAWRCEWLAAIWGRRVFMAGFIAIIIVNKVIISIAQTMFDSSKMLDLLEPTCACVCLAGAISLSIAEHYYFTSGLSDMRLQDD